MTDAARIAEIRLMAQHSLSPFPDLALSAVEIIALCNAADELATYRETLLPVASASAEKAIAERDAANARAETLQKERDDAMRGWKECTSDERSRIEQLAKAEAERDELRQFKDDFVHDREAYTSGIERHRQTQDLLRDTKVELATSEARVRELEGALEPFHKLIEAIECTTDHPLSDDDTWDLPDGAIVKLRDLRRARSVLSPKKDNADAS